MHIYGAWCIALHAFRYRLSWLGWILYDILLQSYQIHRYAGYKDRLLWHRADRNKARLHLLQLLSVDDWPLVGKHAVWSDVIDGLHCDHHRGCRADLVSYDGLVRRTSPCEGRGFVTRTVPIRMAPAW